MFGGVLDRVLVGRRPPRPLRSGVVYLSETEAGIAKFADVIITDATEYDLMGKGLAGQDGQRLKRSH